MKNLSNNDALQTAKYIKSYLLGSLIFIKLSCLRHALFPLYLKESVENDPVALPMIGLLAFHSDNYSSCMNDIC